MSDNDVSLLKDKAFNLLDCGEKYSAKSLFEQACAQDSHDAEARMMLGVINAESGDLNAAEKHLAIALALEPEYADVHFHMGNILQSKGQIDEALIKVKRAVELDPGFSDAKKLLADLQKKPSYAGHAGTQQTETVTSALQEQFNNANTLIQRGELDEAARLFESVTRQHPDLATAWFMLGRTHSQQARYKEALKCCKEAVRLDPALLEAHLILATIFLMQGETEQAVGHSDLALRLKPSDINAIALAANIAKHMGQPEKSYKLLSPLLDDGVKQINVVLAFAMISRDIGRQQQAINLLEEVLESQPTMNAAGRSNLHFNLGTLYDDIKQYDQAFMHFRQGNELKSTNFDPLQYRKYINDYLTIQSAGFLAALPLSRVSSERPVFIVGMVRSGTSLLEHILSSHPDAHGAGELGDIYRISSALPGLLATSVSYPECLTLLSQQQVDNLSRQYLDHLEKLSPDAERVIDKLPGNYMHLGLIEILFPGARIIHCMRDPVDTCLSTYFQDFSTVHPYAYDLTDLGEYYQNYLKLMAHWRKVLRIPLFEVNYEDLISDQEDVTRNLLEFCGLRWDNRCLDYHKNKRFVRTASYDQVNKPLYTKSVARWKNYESHLQPLLKALNSDQI